VSHTPGYVARHGLSGKGGRKRYKIQANIVKAGPSTLPDSGRRIHFFAKGHVMVRKGGSRQLGTAVGIASSQMPPNRSEPETAKKIGEQLAKYAQHEFDYRLSKA
jgi:hypothetical protein